MDNGGFFASWQRVMTETGMFVPGGPIRPWSAFAGMCEDAGALDQIVNSDPVPPAHPLTPSVHRSGGYAMWDCILASGVSKCRMESASGRHTPTPVFGTPLNNSMDNYIRALSVNDLRLMGGFACDLRAAADGRDQLETAHTMAHHAAQNLPLAAGLNRGFTSSAEYMLQATADVAAARALSVPLRMDSTTTRLPYGIRVSWCVKYNTNHSPPCAWFPYRIPVKSRPFDRVFVNILAVIDVAAPPIEFILPQNQPDPWADWWSFQPVRTALLGWTTMDWLAVQSVVKLPRMNVQTKTPQGFTVQVGDTMPMTSFHRYMSDAAEVLPVTDEFMFLEDYSSNKNSEFNEARNYTPPLPCHWCAVMSPVTGEPPPGGAPVRLARNPEWSRYLTKVGSMLKSAKSAKRRYRGNRASRQESARQRAWNQRIARNRKKVGER